MSRQKCSFSSVYETSNDGGAVHGFFALQLENSNDSTCYSVRLFVANALVQVAFLKQTLLVAFNTVPHMKRIQVKIPSNVKNGIFESSLIRCGFKYITDGPEQEILSLDRYNILPRLIIRPACVEDVDGVRQLLKQSDISHVVDSDYDFAAFVDPTATRITDGNKDVSKAFVAEYKEKVVGFMKCTNEIQEKTLKRSFFLDEFVAGPVADPHDIKLKNQRLKASLHSLAARNVGESELKGSMAALSMSSLSDITADLNRVGDLDDYSISKDLVAITLFCIDPEFSPQSHEFLKSCFTAYPSQSHCVIVAPNNSREIPLLSHFSLVPPRKMVRNSLYIYSKASALQCKIQKSVKESDLHGLYEMIKGLPDEREMIQRIHLKMSNSAEASNLFVVKAHTKIIGFIESSNTNVNDVNQYDWESVLLLNTLGGKSSMKRIISFVLDPIFSHHTRLILEMFLKCNDCVAAYALYPNHNYPSIIRQTLAPFLVPVKPHKRVIYPNNRRDNVSVPDAIPFSMHVLSTDMIFEPRVRQNSQILIVGASTVSYGVIEQLIYNPNVYFTNVSLIDDQAKSNNSQNTHNITNDFPQSDSNGDNAGKITVTEAFVDELSFWPEEFIQLGLAAGINLRHGKMANINRPGRELLTDDGMILPYDFLILACGIQYHPGIISPEFEHIDNVVGLNNSSSKSIAEHVDYMARHSFVPTTNSQKIMTVVYGWNLQSLNLIWYLLKRGTRPDQVLVVKPRSKGHRSAMISENKFVEQEIDSFLKNIGIVKYEGDIESWKCEGDRLVQIVVGGSAVEVSFMFYCHVKSPSIDNCRVFNEASLVFDNRLVVNAEYQTEDKFIFAGGSITKYSSRYKTNFCHEYFESREVGNDLGNILLSRFFDCRAGDYTSRSSVQILSSCKRFFARLPGDWEYFHMDKPHIPHDTVFERSEMGHTVTGKLLETNTSNGYMSMHIMPVTGKIRSLSVFTPLLGNRNFWSACNFISLYDLNCAYCNNLMSRYQDKLIPDFLSYFSENWAFAVFDSRFKTRLNSLMLDITVDLATKKKIPIDDLRVILNELRIARESDVHENTEKKQEQVYIKFDQMKSRGHIVDTVVWPKLEQFLPGANSRTNLRSK